MSQKKTITIPALVGSSNLTEIFGKITFTAEVKQLLTRLEAGVSVRYNPGSTAPTIEVVKNSGGILCSLEEFIALSSSRKFVSEAIKEVEKTSASNERISSVGFFLRRAAVGNIATPARIIESNMTKFNQVESSLKLVEFNFENINDKAVDNKWKDYLLDHGSRIRRVLLTMQIACMGSVIIDRDHIETLLFNAGVPKWVYNKFTDKNFTGNFNSDAVVLLFPKNNYLKSINLSTRELASEPFLTKNQIVLAKSGGIIHLSRADFSAHFPQYPDTMAEQVQTYLAKYSWTLTNPYDSDEILRARETGKTIPLFREIMTTRSTDKKNRPESEAGRICRTIGNFLGRLQTTWNEILNFVVIVSDARNEFWTTLYPNAVNWVVTPTNTIYDCIRTEGNLNPLEAIRNAENAAVLALIGSIAAQKLQIPYGTGHFTALRNSFTPILNRQAFRQFADFIDRIDEDHPLQNLDTLEANPVTADEIIAAKTFLGLATRIKRAPKKNGASRVRIASLALNELSLIKGHDIYDHAYAWIASTFKSGGRAILQQVAAERIVGDALGASDYIFDENFDEMEGILEIEEFEEDD